MYHAYEEARVQAQFEADRDGFDRGIDSSVMYSQPDDRRYYRVFLLPRRENRAGYELLCEVVSCSFVEKCQPGHGPVQTNHFDHCEDCRSRAYSGDACDEGSRILAKHPLSAIR